MTSPILTKLVDIIAKEGGSDLHLASGRKPTIRVSGVLLPLEQSPEITDEDMEGILGDMVNEAMRAELQEKKELDFSFDTGTVRFRGNAFVRKGKFAVALRLIPKDIKTIAELNLPPIIADFARKKQGFFLVVGPVGSGKSTTLASMIDLINHERAEHVITIEDPMEYLFEPDRSLIDQREVGIDTKGFDAALQSSFRQDVDVLMVGEMRSQETMAAAITAAETGHLVFSTLHTNDAAQTIDRIIDIFPPNAQDQIRSQLAASLLGIFSQRLIPRVSGGLIPAYELLINNKAVANLIREGRSHEIPSYLETGSEAGMISMNKTLAELIRAGEIAPEDAELYSSDPRGLSRLV